MKINPLPLIACLPLALSACVTGDGNRALVGAGAGALAGEVLFDEPLTGAAVGAAGGFFCDDLGVRACR
jgi:osmotically inducible lipoprotein OsmB